MPTFGATLENSPSSIVRLQAKDKPTNVKFGATLPTNSLATDPAAAFRETLRQQMTSITTEKDPRVKLNLISQLSSASHKRAAEIATTIAERLRSESRIPMLKERLRELDKGGIGNLLGSLINRRMGIPPEQNTVRLSLEDERQEITRRIKLELSQNPDIVAIGALQDSFGFLNTQTKLATSEINKKTSDEIRDENRVDITAERKSAADLRLRESRISAGITASTALQNQKLLIEERKDVRKEERQEKKEDQRIDLLNALDQDQLEAARIISGKHRTDFTIGDYVIQNLKSKDFQEVLASVGSPEVIQSIALEGNVTAQKYMTIKQAEILSGTEDRTDSKYIGELAISKNDIKEMFKVMTSPTQFAIAMDRVYGSKGTSKRDSYDQANLQRTLLMGTREQAIENKRIRSELAADFLTTVNTDTFKSNINSWGAQFTSVMENNPIYMKLVKDKGKNNISIDDYVSSIMSIEDDTNKAKEMQMFETVMAGAAANKNKAYFGFAIDNISVKATLERSVVRSLRGDLEDAFPTIARTAQGVINPLAVLQEEIQKIDEEYNISDYLFGK